MEHEEQTPLKWPDGWRRTRLQDREARPAWQKPYGAAVQMLLAELKRLGATAALITRNDAGSEDGGIAVYFSLKQRDNYGWQEAFDLVGKIPSLDEIDRAYKERIRKIHPDVQPPYKPDLVLFQKLTEYRDEARAWAKGEQRIEHDKVMAVDLFRQQRHNVTAIRLTIAALRQIQRCGNPAMFDRAFRGFSKALITEGGEVEHGANRITVA